LGYFFNPEAKVCEEKQLELSRDVENIFDFISISNSEFSQNHTLIFVVKDRFQLNKFKVTMVVQVSIYLRLFGFFMLFHCQLHFSGGAFQCIEAW
jgi:hypothetical protein